MPLELGSGEQGNITGYTKSGIAFWTRVPLSTIVLYCICSTTNGPSVLVPGFWIGLDLFDDLVEQFDVSHFYLSKMSSVSAFLMRELFVNSWFIFCTMK